MKQIISYVEKPGRRLLAFVLCCVFLATGVFFVQSARYAWNRNWYTGGTRDFADTSACENYVAQNVDYVARYLSWKGDVSEAIATGYGGTAFACVVRDQNTGEVILDTTTEQSRPVMSTDGVRYSETKELYFDASGEQVLTAGEASRTVLSERERYFTVEGYVNTPVEPYGGCYAEWRVHGLLSALANWAIPLAVVFLLLAAAAAGLLLLWAVVWNEPKENSLWTRVPADGALALMILLAVVLFGWAQGLFSQVLFRMASGAYMVFETLRNDFFQPSMKALLWTAGGLAAALVIIEQRRLRCLRRRLLVNRLSLMGGMGLCAAGMVVLGIVDFIRWRRMWIIANETALIFAVHLALGLGVLLMLVYLSRQLKKLRAGAEALAAGDLEHKLDAEALPAGLREQGESLNRVGDGMRTAVEERLRGERFKTELITNVSHDLKTPLTSIVSYVDLLKKEDISSPRAKEYIEVIDRQSAKLKKLTEDLVEASKASSGAIEVHREPVDVAELLSQSVGEYTERLQKASVEPVTSLPEEGCVMNTDGRLLWRVLDNLIQNIVKYAQPGTRAYFDLTKSPDGLFIELKNTSAQALNIPAEALMERFVRGDSARSTEGSGLGLSIAQSLTELLGGTMSLYLDGDLFKVTLRFEGVENT